MTRVAVLVLQAMVATLPAARRDWGEAILAEAGTVPAGATRLIWLAGGAWVVAQEAGMVRRLGYLAAGLSAGAAIVWLDWHPGSTNPAAPTNRLTVLMVVLLLALLPWVSRLVLGPVADNRTARLVRTTGYLGVYALVLVMADLSRFAGSRFDDMQAFDQNSWSADERGEAIVSAVLIITIFTGYAVAVLALTAQRTAVNPRTLRIGVGFGALTGLAGYALMPLGNVAHLTGPLKIGYGLVLVLVPPAAMVGAGILAGRRTRAVGPGALAGLCAGGSAVLLLFVLTIATMLLFPRHVTLQWDNPSPAAPHGTEYEVKMSVGDAAVKYEVALLFGPLAGLVLGAVGAGGQAGGPALTGGRPTDPARRRRADDGELIAAG